MRDYISNRVITSFPSLDKETQRVIKDFTTHEKVLMNELEHFQDLEQSFSSVFNLSPNELCTIIKDSFVELENLKASLKNEYNYIDHNITNKKVIIGVCIIALRKLILSLDKMNVRKNDDAKSRYVPELVDYKKIEAKDEGYEKPKGY